MILSPRHGELGRQAIRIAIISAPALAGDIVMRWLGHIACCGASPLSPMSSSRGATPGSLIIYRHVDAPLEAEQGRRKWSWKIPTTVEAGPGRHFSFSSELSRSFCYGAT